MWYFAPSCPMNQTSWSASASWSAGQSGVSVCGSESHVRAWDANAGSPGWRISKTSRSSRRAVVPMRSNRRDWPVSCSFRSASACVRKHPRLTSAELSTQYCVSNDFTVMASSAACADSSSVNPHGRFVAPEPVKQNCGILGDRDAILGGVRLVLGVEAAVGRSRAAVIHAPLPGGTRGPGGTGRTRRPGRVLRDAQPLDRGLGVLLGREADVLQRQLVARQAAERPVRHRDAVQRGLGARRLRPTSVVHVVGADQARLVLRALLDGPFRQAGQLHLDVLTRDEDLRLADAERVHPVADVLQRLLHHRIRRVRRRLQDDRDAALQIEPERRLQRAGGEPDQRGHDQDQDHADGGPQPAGSLHASSAPLIVSRNRASSCSAA